MMKQTLSFIFMGLLIFSCGNPHINTRNEDQPIVEPITADCLMSLGHEIQYFLEMNKTFHSFTKCAHESHEDFRKTPEGETQVVKGPGHEITHRTEGPHDKLESLDYIFSSHTFPMKVMDHNLDSTIGSLDKKDALIWAFQRPVSGFGVKMMNFTSFGKEKASIKLFDCSKELIDTKDLEKDSKIEFVGFISPYEDICYVSITAAKTTESLKVDEFKFWSL